MIVKDLGRRIRSLLVLTGDYRRVRAGREPIEAVQRARRGQGLPAPAQALDTAPQREGAEFLAPVGRVEPEDAAKLRSAGVGIDPCRRGLALVEMLRRRQRRVGWNRRH